MLTTKPQGSLPRSWKCLRPVHPDVLSLEDSVEKDPDKRKDEMYHK